MALWLRCYKCYLLPGTTIYTTMGHTTVHSTQYQCYMLPYITYFVRTRSTCYVLPLAEPSDIGCLQGADASATGISEKACQYPSLTKSHRSFWGSLLMATLITSAAYSKCKDGDNLLTLKIKHLSKRGGGVGSSITT